jgi:hypothetical protein
MEPAVAHDCSRDEDLVRGCSGGDGSDHEAAAGGDHPGLRQGVRCGGPRVSVHLKQGRGVDLLDPVFELDVNGWACPPKAFLARTERSLKARDWTGIATGAGDLFFLPDGIVDPRSGAMGLERKSVSGCLSSAPRGS